MAFPSYFNRFSPHHREVLSAHHHEAHEFVAQKFLNLVCLLDGNTDANGIDGSLNQNSFFFIPADYDRVEE
jgi:hypothetical protein